MSIKSDEYHFKMLACSLLIVCICAQTWNISVVNGYQRLQGRNPRDTLFQNYQEYVKLTEESSNIPSSLLIFPEFGLFGDEVKNNETAWPYCVEVSQNLNKSSIDCDTLTKDFDLIYCLAQLTHKMQISISVNICLQEGQKIYNAELIIVPFLPGAEPFSSIVNIYKKIHPFFDYFTPGNTPAIYSLQLNASGKEVMFGTFTCFDILFKNSYEKAILEGVKHFVYSASIPLIGDDAEKIWSRKYNATLYASNLAKGESGIFRDGKQIGFGNGAIITASLS